MTAQIPAEGPFYRADGSFLGYVGVAATLKLDLVATQVSGPPLPQDLTGRVFLQRVLDGGGQTLREIYGANGVDGIAHRIAFPLTEDDELALLPTGGAVARDLTYAVGEVTIGGFDQIYSAPFALRRIRRGMPATVLQLEPNAGIVLVRYAGAPPLSLLEELITSGDLAEGATHADLVAWLQNPANDAAQAALTAIGEREAVAVAAVATREGQAINAGGAIDVREDAALTTIAAREGEAINAGGAIDVREDAALAAVVAREGAAINVGGAIDVREDAALAAVATREGQAIDVGGAIDVREDAAVAAIAFAEAGVVDPSGSIDAREDQALAAIDVAAASAATVAVDAELESISQQLAVAASARVFDSKVDLLAACAEGESGWVRQAHGLKAEGFVDKAGVAVSTGRTMLLGSGSAAALTAGLLQSPLVCGSPPDGAYIDVDFADLAFTDGRAAQNRLVECPPTIFTMAPDQAVTVTANCAGVLNVWAARPLIEDASIELWFTISEALAAAGNGAITFGILQANDAILTTPDTIYSTQAMLKQTLVLGYVVKIKVPLDLLTKQYLGVKYTVTNGPLTAGKVTCQAYAYTGRPPLSFLVFNKAAQLRNQGSGPTIAPTLTGSDRGVTFTANQSLTLHDNDPVVSPGEKWWMEIEVAGGVGSGGGQQLRYGDPETYQTTPALADSVFQKLSYVFDGAGTRLPKITTTAGATANVQFRSIRTGPGGVVPDSAERHQGHAYGSFCTRGRIERVGLANRKKTDTGNRITITRNPGLVRSTHTQKQGHTIFAAVYIPPAAGGNDTPIVTPIYDSFSSPTIASSTLAIMLDNFQHTVGELSLRPDQASSRVTGYHEPRPGWHILALRRRQTPTDFETSLWMDGAPCLRTYTPTGDVQLLGYWLGAYASTMNHAPSTFVSNVSYASFMEAPRGLTDDEMLEEFTRQRAKLALKGLTLAVDPYGFIAPGTSRTAWDSLPSWAWQIARVLRPANADGSNRFNYFNCANGGMSYQAGLLSSSAAKTVETLANSGAVRASNVLTIKTTTVHQRLVGEVVTLWGCADPTMDGSYTILTSPTTTTFTVANAGADAVSGTGMVTPHRDDFSSVHYREVVPIIRGLRWAGTKIIYFMPDTINDAGWINTTVGHNRDYNGGAGTPDPAGWNIALTGWENVRDCFHKVMAGLVRAELGPADEIWSYDAMVRTDSFGTTSGYMPAAGGRDNYNGWQRSGENIGVYVDKHISMAGSNWDTAALVTGNAYLGGDGLHDSSTGSLAMANVINPHIQALP